MKTITHFWLYLTQFFLEWEMFQTKLVDEIKTHMLRSITFLKNCTIYEIMLKNILRARQVTVDNITQRMHIACHVPKARHTLRICNNYCFTTATVVTWMCPSIALYVSCHLSCSGLAWIFEFLLYKHKETSMWHARPFTSVF